MYVIDLQVSKMYAGFGFVCNLQDSSLLYTRTNLRMVKISVICVCHRRRFTCVVKTKACDFAHLGSFVAHKGENRARKFHCMYKLITGRAGGKYGEMFRRDKII